MSATPAKEDTKIKIDEALLKGSFDITLLSAAPTVLDLEHVSHAMARYAEEYLGGATGSSVDLREFTYIALGIYDHEGECGIRIPVRHIIGAMAKTSRVRNLKLRTDIGFVLPGVQLPIVRKVDASLDLQSGHARFKTIA